jgi:hypothetical protein
MGADTDPHAQTVGLVAWLLQEVELETDANGLERVKLKRDGWKFWTWVDDGTEHKIHYIQLGMCNQCAKACRSFVFDDSVCSASNVLRTSSSMSDIVIW